jgi:multidrug efflux pump subunit AcrB
MMAIPLTFFGAIAGLVITGNVLGFTASVGLISLVGIVIRNSIILVDYADELRRKEGLSSKEAAIDAGLRRIRPIFLTSMAAAVGVLPMIISGSPLWAPLASVFSVGIIWSMVMTLLVIPAFYAVVMKNVPVTPSGQEAKS